MRLNYLLFLSLLFFTSQLFSQIFSVIPEIKIHKSAREIQQGDSLIISWHVEKAKTFTFLNENRDIPLSGTLRLKPDTTTVYKFVAKRKKRSKKKTIRITVRAPVIHYFTGPAEISDEHNIELKWRAQYFQNLYIEDISKDLPENGKISIPADTTRTYKMIAINKFGIKTEKSFQVKVNYDENLDSNITVLIGDTAHITWKFKNTKYVEIAGGNIKYKPIDKANVYTKMSSGINLMVHKINGDTIHYQCKITVIRPKIHEFTGERSIFKGEEVELEWRAGNVRYVNLTGIQDSLPPIGRYVVKPFNTTKYELKINCRGIEEKRIHNVKVFQRHFVNDVLAISQVKDDIRLDFEIFATDKSKYPEEIKLYVLVVDTNGNFIQNLAPPHGTKAIAKKYFRGIIETIEGDDIKVRDFSVREIREEISNPYDINLTLDYSGSMKNSIKKLEKAVKLFIEHKNEKDRLSIVKFDHRLVLESPLSDKIEDLLGRVKFNGLRDLGGYTALYAGADEGLMSLTDSSQNRQQILFTDGHENASFGYYNTREFTAQGLAKKACNQKIRMNIVTYGEGANEPLLRYLSMLTGGNYYNINKPKDILEVLEEIPRINRNYYVITYKPYKKEGERSLKLVYYNNVTKVNEKREIFIGEDFDLSKFEFQNDSYWNRRTPGWNNMKPVSPPQVVSLFELNNYLLDDKDKAKIDTYILFLEKNQNVKVKIFGHTDQSGNDLYCDNLSKKRAVEVENYLVAKGISEDRLKIIACGKNNPVWQIEDKDWKSKENRRVELLLLQ